MTAIVRLSDYRPDVFDVAMRDAVIAAWLMLGGMFILGHVLAGVWFYVVGGM